MVYIWNKMPLMGSLILGKWLFISDARTNISAEI